MELIFHHVPETTTHRDLFLFAQEGARSWWPFAPTPEITFCEILDIQDKETGSIEHHGLVKFSDPVMAERALRRLNGRNLNGKKILVKEYSHRSPGDHRLKEIVLGRERPPERRRSHLKVTNRGDKAAVDEHNDSIHHHSG